MNEHTQPDQTDQERRPSPMTVVRKELAAMWEQFKAALPAHIPVERFTRVVQTAIQNNQDLLACSRRSLWNAAMKAAQDGLLPDGRDGAIVPYKGEAQWMPMIGGLRKKVRNSGEIRDWYVEVVYAGDHFHFQKGDDPRLHHAPVPPSQRTPGLRHQGIIAAYSIAVFNDGSKSVPEVMWIEEIEGVRSKSKGKNTPWNDPIFYPEMVRKTVARRHAKSLPMSTDLDDLIRHDDALYDLEGQRKEGDEQTKAAGVLTSTASVLDQFASMGDGETIEIEPQMDEARTPYEEGRLARRAGKGFRDNPYDRETGGAVQWGLGWQDEDKQQHTGELVDSRESDAKTDPPHDPKTGELLEDEADAGEPLDVKEWLAELDTLMAEARSEADLNRVWKEYAAPNKARVSAEDWREAEKVFDRHATRLGL